MYFGTQVLTMDYKGGQAIVARLHIQEHMLERVYGPRMKSFAIAIDKRERWQGTSLL
jgi:hypothetical protein